MGCGMLGAYVVIWLPSWILLKIRNSKKTAKIDIFLMLEMWNMA